MFDVLGSILRVTPHFRGKARLFRYWSRHLDSNEKRVARLPGGSSVEVSMGVPYERMVWLEDEEWDELEYLRRRLHKGEIFVDVGANIGLWTLVAASTVGHEGRVFSFEPNPNTFQKLMRNIERNREDAVVVPQQRAVSSECEPVSFYCAADHNISAIAPSDADTISVEAVTLDSILSGVIAGIKLDTEGHELASLQGAARTIAKSSPWLIVEFNTTLMPSNRLEDWEVCRYLGRMGYKPYIYEDAPGTERRVDGAYYVKGYRNILFQR